MPRGGWRGGGRPKGFKFPRTMRIEEAKAKAVEQILQHLSPLLQTQLEMALGDYYYEKVDDVTGKRKIFKARPQMSAITALLEFTFGKAKQPIEGKIDGTFETPGMNLIADKLQQLLDSKRKRSPAKPPSILPPAQSAPQPPPVPASTITPSPIPEAIPTPVQVSAIPTPDTNPAPPGVNPAAILTNGANTNAGTS